MRNTCRRLSWSWVLRLLVLLGSCWGAQEVVGANGTVALEESGTNSFRLRTGDYTLTYDPQQRADKKGWIVIHRDHCENGLATKLANGQFLDVTDPAAGEDSIYNWDQPRKDSRMFRSLAFEETSNTLEITLRSERDWSGFESRLMAYKKHPGLIHWKVIATAKRDQAFSGKPVPDLFFVTGETVWQWGGTGRAAVRYTTQRGPESGIVYFRDLDLKSFVFYFEDFTSMNALYRLTRCENPYDHPSIGAPGAVKMGNAESWFQMSSRDGSKIHPLKPFEEKVASYTQFGYERPHCFRVPKATTLALSDTYLYLKPAPESTDTVTICRNFVEMQGDIFQFIQKPPVIKTDWAGKVVPRMLKDILRPENTSELQGGKHKVPRAYVAYEHADAQLWTLAQLLHPLELYLKKSPPQKEATELRDRLDAALPLFFDQSWGGFMNNPAPIPLDQYAHAVYLFNPAVMISDLARLGNANAKAMLLGFRDRLLEMGKAYNYEMADLWLRDFSKQKGHYQADATACFMYVMMGLYDLSNGQDQESLAAAKAAAERLRLRGLDLMWESNMTAAGTVACEQLYRATGDVKYRELGYIPLANLLRSAWLWECDYGMGEFTTTFWSFSPCPSAPSSAEFETHRVRVHLKDYAEMAGSWISPTVRAMLQDAWQRGPTQSRFSLPPLLVESGATAFMAREGRSETNCGEIRHDQMIPLEDVRAGWGTDLEWWQNNSRLGVVGQEIYGTGGPIWYALWQE